MFHAPRSAPTRAAMTVVYNPLAGERRASLLWRVLDVLTANGVRLDLVETERPGHAAELAREAARGGARTVVAAGGDGTIAEVAGGIAGAPARLGIVPLGSANVLARELGLAMTPSGVAAALAFGRTRRIYPGLLETGGGRRLFVQMVGVGFDGQVVHRLSPRLKRWLGRGAYVAQFARELPRYGFPRLLVTIDGLASETGGVVICKGRLYGGRYELAPGADPGRPGFTTALFDRAGMLAAVRYGLALPLGRLGRAESVRRCLGRTITVGTVAPVQADGDAAGFAPLSVTDAAAAIDVVVG